MHLAWLDFGIRLMRFLWQMIWQCIWQMECGWSLFGLSSTLLLFFAFCWVKFSLLNIYTGNDLLKAEWIIICMNFAVCLCVWEAGKAKMDKCQLSLWVGPPFVENFRHPWQAKIVPQLILTCSCYFIDQKWNVFINENYWIYLLFVLRL